MLSGPLSRFRRLFDQNARRTRFRHRTLYRQIIEQSLEGVWMSDLSGRTIFVNDQMARMLGYSPEELIGTSPTAVMAPEDIPPLLERWEKRRKGEATSTQRFEMCYRRRDGSRLWVLVSSGALTDAKGRTTGFFAMHVDITERKQMEKMLRMQSQVLDQLSESVQLADEDGYIVYANPATARLFGYSLDEMVGMHMVRFFPEPESDLWMRFRSIVDRLQAGEELWSGERVYQRKDGEKVITETYILPLENDGRKYWVCVREDITEKRRTEKLLLEQQAKLASSSKLSALGEMSGGIAHEINNPLTIIHAKAARLKELAHAAVLSPAEVGRTAERIEATALRISRIVKSLRVFAREADHDPVEPVRLQGILDDTAELCRERFRNHGIRLIIDPVPEKLQMSCRPVQICQVLLNLLSNAHDACLLDRAEDRWVNLAVNAGPDSLEISVTDSGQGVPAEMGERIFEPFFTTKEVGKGTGLGLSVSKGLVESHGGSLRLDPTAPHTRFVARFPHAPAAQLEGGSGP